MTPSVSEVAPVAVDRLEAGPRGRRRPGLVRWLLRGLVAGLVTAVLLAALSVATATGWRAPEDVAPLEVAPLPVLPIWVQHLPYAFVDRVDLDTGTGLRARVVRPRGAEGTIPGVVLVDGSGATTRDDLAAEAEALARGGLAVLTYDKRTAGYGPLRRSYDRLADDALGAVATLGRQRGVDPGRVGLLGVSEGTWVTALAAVRDPGRVAFTVLVSAPVVTPLEQAAYVVDQRLAGRPTVVRSAAATGLVLGRPVARWLGTDVGPQLAAGTQPSYAVWGADDATVPVAVAARRYGGAVGDRGRSEVVAGAGHRIGLGTGWAERVSDWVRQGYPRDDRVRGVQPATLGGLPTLPRPGRPADPRVALGLAALVALAVAVVPSRGGRVRSARSG